MENMENFVKEILEYKKRASMENALLYEVKVSQLEHLKLTAKEKEIAKIDMEIGAMLKLKWDWLLQNEYWRNLDFKEFNNKIKNNLVEEYEMAVYFRNKAIADRRIADIEYAYLTEIGSPVKLSFAINDNIKERFAKTGESMEFRSIYESPEIISLAEMYEEDFLELKNYLFNNEETRAKLVDAENKTSGIFGAVRLALGKAKIPNQILCSEVMKGLAEKDREE